jgi:hexosaminidase
MKILFLLFILWLFQPDYSFAAVNVIPYPQEVTIKGDDIEITTGFIIKADEEFSKIRSFLVKSLAGVNPGPAGNKDNMRGMGFPVSLRKDLSLSEKDESYVLDVSDTGVVISSATEKGCFYGVQTLRQLIRVDNGSLSISNVRIYDFPDLSWRAYLLDEARYFFGMEFVKGLLEELASMKFNKLHWHLTDDAGWRVEIRKYPRLTSVGAFRKDTQTGGWGSEKRSGVPHGGYYTQDEIREIIDYASALHIDIIPEIEMPGHASAAIAAYPWLGIIGELTEVPAEFGKMPDSYNIADPKVLEFLHDVLDEIADLFPYEVIHIGGDEVLFEAWAESADIQAYMKEHGLLSPADAQIHFTNHISNYLDAKGKRMMGWNEILGDNLHDFDEDNYLTGGASLSRDAIVHFWKGDIELLTQAAESGYHIVNSLHSETYLDYTYSSLPLERVYGFEPIPADLDEKYHDYIMGIGTQMWAEWTPTYRDIEYQTFPRVAAVAEVGWSGSRDYDDFLKRLHIMAEEWKRRGINFPFGQIK